MGGSATAGTQLVVTDPALRRRLFEAARAAGMLVRVNDYHRGGVQDQPVVATTADGEPFTAFGGRIGRADMRIQWRGHGRQLCSRAARGMYVSVVAPEYGPAGERLWDTLASADRCPADLLAPTGPSLSAAPARSARARPPSRTEWRLACSSRSPPSCSWPSRFDVAVGNPGKPGKAQPHTRGHSVGHRDTGMTYVTAIRDDEQVEYRLREQAGCSVVASEDVVQEQPDRALEYRLREEGDAALVWMGSGLV